MTGVQTCALPICKIGEAGSVELAMSEAALTGFLSWLEAAPPGSYMDQIA